MVLHIPQLQDVEELTLELNSRECDFPEDVGKLRAPILLEAHLRKVGKEITIEGQLSTVVEMLCSRCLKTHKEILTDTFEVVYWPKTDLESFADDVELDEAELDRYTYENETLSLKELVRDQLLLMVPVKPLCQPDCAGLCPSCGKDLNKGPCECVSQTGDPRLAVLEKLLP
jgi:uncharacterized protein